MMILSESARVEAAVGAFPYCSMSSGFCKAFPSSRLFSRADVRFSKHLVPNQKEFPRFSGCFLRLAYHIRHT